MLWISPKCWNLLKIIGFWWFQGFQEIWRHLDILTILNRSQKVGRNENYLSNTSETHVSERKNSPDLIGVVYPWWSSYQISWNPWKLLILVKILDIPRCLLLRYDRRYYYKLHWVYHKNAKNHEIFGNLTCILPETTRKHLARPTTSIPPASGANYSCWR